VTKKAKRPKHMKRRSIRVKGIPIPQRAKHGYARKRK
jgi:hypothetical protein